MSCAQDIICRVRNIIYYPPKREKHKNKMHVLNKALWVLDFFFQWCMYNGNDVHGSHHSPEQHLQRSLYHTPRNTYVSLHFVLFNERLIFLFVTEYTLIFWYDIGLSATIDCKINESNSFNFVVNKLNMHLFSFSIRIRVTQQGQVIWQIWKILRNIRWINPLQLFLHCTNNQYDDIRNSDDSQEYY